jgi:hypothetical protein
VHNLPNIRKGHRLFVLIFFSFSLYRVILMKYNIFHTLYGVAGQPISDVGVEPRIVNLVSTVDGGEWSALSLGHVTPMHVSQIRYGQWRRQISAGAGSYV